MERGRSQDYEGKSRPRGVWPFVGNKDTMKVHVVGCKWAEQLARGNRIFFKKYGDAVEAGYEPCRVCKPDQVALEEAASRTTPFVGNKGNKKVHRSECTWADKISDANRVPFDTYREAAAQGYAPCGACKPDRPAGSGTPGGKGGH
jgi:methylphosphotriester-DNA--protein-cysteine methyltransferase